MSADVYTAGRCRPPQSVCLISSTYIYWKITLFPHQQSLIFQHDVIRKTSADYL